MCDYSLHHVTSGPAKVGDKLTTRDFRLGTRGFAASEDASVAVCVLPGTELSFAGEVTCLPTGLFGWRDSVIKHKTAIFRQINKEKIAAHHDALEFPDGRIVLLTILHEGQQATVLQLPAKPKTGVKTEAQKRAAYDGLTVRDKIADGGHPARRWSPPFPRRRSVPQTKRNPPRITPGDSQGKLYDLKWLVGGSRVIWLISERACVWAPAMRAVLCRQSIGNRQFYGGALAVERRTRVYAGACSKLGDHEHYG